MREDAEGERGGEPGPPSAEEKGCRHEQDEQERERVGHEPAVVDRGREQQMAERLVDQVRQDAAEKAGRDEPAVARRTGEGEADRGPHEEMAEDEQG